MVRVRIRIRAGIRIRIRVRVRGIFKSYSFSSYEKTKTLKN